MPQVCHYITGLTYTMAFHMRCIFNMKLFVLALVLLSYESYGVYAAPTPDMTAMLDHLGGTDISKLLDVVHEFKMAKDIFKDATSVNPFFLQVLNTLAKENPKLEVILKVMEGEMPNIHDLYKLATTHKKSIYTKTLPVFAANPDLHKYFHLISSPDLLTNQQNMEQLMEMVTGKKIKFRNETDLLQRMQSSNYQIRPGDDIAVVNLVEFMTFVSKNIRNIGNLTTSYEKGARASDVLSMIADLDYSNLQKIVEQPTMLKDGKYQVGLRNLKRDPDVLQIMSHVTSGIVPKASDTVESLITEIVKLFFNLEGKLLHNAEAVEGTVRGKISTIG